MKNLSSLIALSLLFLAIPVQAANPLDVVINEIAWMGTEVSYSDEWIELYNNTDSLINLDGWFIIHFTQKGEQGSSFDLSGTIPSHGFYLLERTDDNSVPNITADKIYTGPLNNNGELLQLSDEQGTIVDLINCVDSGWFAGDNKTKQTMERISPDSLGLEPENWQTSQNPGGTPKAKNSVVIETSQLPLEEEIKEPGLQPTAGNVEVKPQQSQLLFYPSGVVINEVLPSPTGPDELEEWIEIFNQNNFEVDLSGWRISDTTGSINTYTFSERTIISPQGFLVLPRPTTKITLNNDGDGLNLIQPNGNIIDSVNYEKAPRGQSYNRIPLESKSGWIWSTILTPGSSNIIPAQVPEIKEEIEKPTLKEEIGKEEVKEELAAIDEQIPKAIFDSLFIFLNAFGIATFSGITILILKKKLKRLIY